MTDLLKKSFLMLFVFYCSNIWAQTDFSKEDGSCQKPFIINDSAFSIRLNTIQKEKIWFEFTSKKREIFLNITDSNNRQYNYIVFKKTGSDFCNQVANKALIPERNKVCDKKIIYDASSGLSYENINRGMCKCELCCLSHALFYTIPYETYIIIVYNPDTYINISFKNEKSTAVVIDEIPLKKKTKDRKIDKSTNIKDINVGETLTLENIYFEAGTSNILPISYEAIEGLQAFLVNNPSVNIEIQGHVNGPNQPLDINYSNNLGYRRARAVYDYLVNRKIDKERLTYKGYGNTMMIYPNATSEIEMIKNRRVEILILSK